jgi:AraC-like DNA-binding protein
MSELVNNRIPLSLLLNAKETTLFNQLNSQLKDEDRVKLLEEWMLVQLPIAKKNLSIIDEVADFIDEKKGLIAIEEVAVKFKVSRRYLEKQFLQKVGVSPKLYTRLKRFVMLSLELAYNNNSDWQELLEKAKLHDQSHLVKEFLEFNKENPTEYFKNHHEMTRFVKTK